MSEFDKAKFEASLSRALGTIRLILDNNRTLTRPDTVAHTYEDKYLLAEFLTTSVLGSFLNTLQALGIDKKQLTTLQDWAQTRSVTLRLTSEETCTFLRKKERKVETNLGITSFLGRISPRRLVSERIVSKVTDYIWNYSYSWELFLFQGNTPETSIPLFSRKATGKLTTTSEEPPRPQTIINPPIDVNLTWLFQQLDKELNLQFHIKRESKRCLTPRRNPDVSQALSFISGFASWQSKVEKYFLKDIFPYSTRAKSVDISAIRTQASTIFLPVVPLFTSSAQANSIPSKKELKKKPSSFALLTPEGQKSRLIPFDDLSAFLDEQVRSMREIDGLLDKSFSGGNGHLIVAVEAKMLAKFMHFNDLGQQYLQGINFIEWMLRSQIISALGRELTPVDFNAYMVYNHRQLFKPEYEPKKFCYSIRRPSFSPEGVISLLAYQNDGSIAEPLTMFTAQTQAETPAKFPINASTSVQFYGQRYLHSFLGHQFSGSTGNKLELACRARQFSSYVLMVGRIVTDNLFEPTHAIILKDKDDLRIPLSLETIPSAKEFKESVESLSPEQRAFAKAYRSMQLGQTLFGLLVIQIKPQLERLLNLPSSGLTKEIRLSQDVLELLMDYQIPSGLISYEDEPQAELLTKIMKVQSHVRAVNEMINQAKQEEIQEQKQVVAFVESPSDSCSSDASEDDFDDYECDDDDDDGGYEEVCKVETKSSFRAEKESAPISRRSSSVAVVAKSAPAAVPKSEPAKSVAQPAKQAEPAKPAESAKPADPAKPAEPAKQDKPQPGVELVAAEAKPSGFPYTKIPKRLDKALLQLDPDGAVRPAIMHLGDDWKKTSYKTMLSDPETKTLTVEEQELERSRAYDLLDALTRSGALPIYDAALHVIIASTHCFDKTLLNTLVENNVNPIDKVERSALIITSTIHQTAPADLINPSHLARVSAASPMLFK